MTSEARAKEGLADILDAIGNTSLVRLRKVVPPECAEILVKLEWENPTGSLKDRMAQAVIARAEADGRLKPGDTVDRVHGRQHRRVAGAGVRGASGYAIHIVSSDAFSPEKLDQMAAFGARAHARSERGRADDEEADPRHDRDGAPLEPGAEHVLDGPAQQPRQHRRLPPRSARRSGSRRADAWTRSSTAVGTAASLRGVATVLKRHKPSIRIVAVEPAESPVLLGGEPGPHKIEGVGIGYMPPLWDPSRGGRDPVGRDGGREGDGPAPRPRGGDLRGNVVRAPTSSPRSEWASDSGPGPRSSP